MIVRWIDRYNFEDLNGLEGNNLNNFLDISPENIEYRVAYDDLLPAQKKKLPGMKGEFRIYCTEKSRPPPSLKNKIIKERLYPKKDLIPLIKMIIKEQDRDRVFEELMKEHISPIVLQIWLIRSFSASKEALAVLVEAENYVYQNIPYYLVIASKFKPGDPNVRFKFPKKIRE